MPALRVQIPQVSKEELERVSEEWHDLRQEREVERNIQRRRDPAEAAEKEREHLRKTAADIVENSANLSRIDTPRSEQSDSAANER